MGQRLLEPRMRLGVAEAHERQDGDRRRPLRLRRAPPSGAPGSEPPATAAGIGHRHRRAEAEAAAAHGLDEGLRLAAVAERPARRLDRGRQRRLGDDASVPDRLDHPVPVDHRAGIGDEEARAGRRPAAPRGRRCRPRSIRSGRCRAGTSRICRSRSAARRFPRGSLTILPRPPQAQAAPARQCAGTGGQRSPARATREKTMNQQRPPTVDLGALKARQQTTWASGDYAAIGTTLADRRRAALRDDRPPPRRRASSTSPAATATPASPPPAASAT